jgi:Alpha/beta hydrolase domain
MSRWASGAGEPPSATQIQLLSPGPPVTIARDGYGNAMGGIRLAEFAAATATNTGMNSGPGFCRLYGSYEPFDSATLRAMYPNHAMYVSQGVDVTLDNLSAGFLVMEDAIASIRAAAQSDVGRY